jgi:hypothetical protein
MPPADADLSVGPGSAGASPSRKSLTALPSGAKKIMTCWHFLVQVSKWCNFNESTRDRYSTASLTLRVS